MSLDKDDRARVQGGRFAPAPPKQNKKIRPKSSRQGSATPTRPKRPNREGGEGVEAEDEDVFGSAYEGQDDSNDAGGGDAMQQ